MTNADEKEVGDPIPDDAMHGDPMLDALLAEGRLDAAALDPSAPIETGRMLVTFRDGALAEGMVSIPGVASADIAHSQDFDGQAVSGEALGGASALVFDEIGVAVLGAEAAASLAASGGAGATADDDSHILAIEPETLLFATGVSVDEFLRGFAAASTAIRDGLAGRGALPDEAPEADAPDTSVAVLGNTWGIVATRAHLSSRTGAGIRLAVLDTGINFRHPDFAGRPIWHRSFIPGQTSQDGNGHGTHCAGTAAGLRMPPGSVPRYGVAGSVQLFVGKVLRNDGWSQGGSVLAGMNWAIANNCHVISMSLGGPGGPFLAYTQAGQVALNRGLLIIAAAGNDSRRPGLVRPCGSPGNSPTIMSVAALEPNLTTAPYSNGQPIEIAGPGSSVFSSWPMPQRYRTISGTSMATPHVAGCAALLAQAGGPGMRGNVLRARLRALARPLPGRPDVGSGLVQAVP